MWVFSGSAASLRIFGRIEQTPFAYASAKKDRALRVFAEARGQHSQGIGGSGDDCGLGLHRVFDDERNLFAALFDRGEDQAVLAGEHVEQRDILEAARDEVRDQARHHHRQGSRIVAR